MSKTTHVYLDSNGDRLVVEAGGTLLLTGATVTGTIGCSAPATLAVAGAATVGTTLAVGTADHFGMDANGVMTLNHDGTDITIDGHTTDGTLAITGGIVKITGNGTDPDLTLHGAGSLATEGRTVSGTHVADAGTFAFAADQKSMRINIEGTVYQIPLWADA